MSDEFADVKGSLAGKHGIFANSEGLDNLDTVEKKFDPEGQGMIYNSQCGYCGSPQETLVGWPELVAVAQKRVIAGWYFDRKNGLLRVDQRCMRCAQAPIPWGLTPTEATKDVQAGVEANKVAREQVIQWVQQLQQMPTAS